MTNCFTCARGGWLVVVVHGLFALGACSSGQDAADLPPGWQSAERIDDFTQAACEGSAYPQVPETVDAVAEDGRIAIDYGDARFRCEQDVEGFLRRDAGSVDVLVQPVDMDPESVVRCDCLYDIAMTIAARPGSYELTVYRRWDHLNDSNDPVEIGSTSVDVQ